MCVKLLLAENGDVPNMCVYKIMFGRKYYIGSSKRFLKRMQEHEYYLNKALSEKNTISGMYQNVVKHLLANENILIAYVEVLQVINDVYQLHYAEEEHLFKCHKSKNLLNVWKIAWMRHLKLYYEKKAIKNGLQS